MNSFSIFHRVNITVGVGVSNFQFGGQLEFGKNCLYDADFENDVRLFDEFSLSESLHLVS